MTIATCRSTVVLLPPTPLGLPSARGRVDHTCSLCRQPVLTDQLVEHATGHGRVPDQATEPSMYGQAYIYASAST